MATYSRPGRPPPKASRNTGRGLSDPRIGVPGRRAGVGPDPPSQELTTATASISIMKSGPARRVTPTGRAGRGRHPEIAHADVGALLELVEIGDKGVGLDDVAPGGAGRLEAPVE